MSEPSKYQRQDQRMQEGEQRSSVVSPPSQRGSEARRPSGLEAARAPEGDWNSSAPLTRLSRKGAGRPQDLPTDGLMATPRKPRVSYEGKKTEKNGLPVFLFNKTHIYIYIYIRTPAKTGISKSKTAAK